MSDEPAGSWAPAGAHDASLDWWESATTRTDLAVGHEIEVNQGACTDRPLSVGPDTGYALALGRHDGHPWGQLNEDQAAWQVDATGGLHPVSPRNDLAVATLEQLAAVAETAAPSSSSHPLSP